MTVHFIGAGPGAPDLITVRGLTLIRSCPVVRASSPVIRAIGSPDSTTARAMIASPAASICAATSSRKAARSSGLDAR